MGSRLKFRKFFPTRPEGAEALSPGQRPGLLRMIAYRPVRAKALKYRAIYKAFALTGRQVCEHDNPGRCPGLRASAPSGRAAYMGFWAFSPYINHLRNLS